MSEPFLGQIIAVGFDFAPIGWFPCDGRLLSIAEYAALYNLLGTTFGGNGQTTFGLPDLRGRVAVGTGQAPGLQNYIMGMVAGTENVTLTTGQMATHSHGIMAAIDGTESVPTTATVPGRPPDAQPFVYVPGGGNTSLAAATMVPLQGGGLPHENRQPYQAVNYIIAVEGIYPTQN